MKYTIELTNKQKAQMDCIIDIVYRYVGFNPKLEPMETTNIEDTNEYEIGYKVGFEDGKKQAIEEIPELANKENEIYNDGYNKGLEDGKADAIYNTDLIDELKQVEYIRGLEDAWELITVIETNREVEEEVFGEDLDYNFDNVSVQDAMKKWEAYKEKKKAEEESIKVGDEVICNCPNEQRVIITAKYDGWVTFMRKDGACYSRIEIGMRKTGRHFDEVSQLFDKLRGEEDEKN